MVPATHRQFLSTEFAVGSRTTRDRIRNVISRVSYKRPLFLIARPYWPSAATPLSVFLLRNMVRHLPPELVRLAIGWRGEGLTQGVISWRLGVPQGTISKILKRYRETGQFVQRRRSGRPRISTHEKIVSWPACAEPTAFCLLQCWGPSGCAPSDGVVASGRSEVDSLQAGSERTALADVWP